MSKHHKLSFREARRASLADGTKWCYYCRTMRRHKGKRCQSCGSKRLSELAYRIFSFLERHHVID